VRADVLKRPGCSVDRQPIVDLRPQEPSLGAATSYETRTYSSVPRGTSKTRQENPVRLVSCRLPQQPQARCICVARHQTGANLPFLSRPGVDVTNIPSFTLAQVQSKLSPNRRLLASSVYPCPKTSQSSAQRFHDSASQNRRCFEPSDANSCDTAFGNRLSQRWFSAPEARFVKCRGARN
jgi:hypothetical protein